MSSNDKAAATFHPADDQLADALVGENPCIPPFMERALAAAGPNARSGAQAVFNAVAEVDDAVKHARNLQAAVNDIRQIHHRRPLLIRGTTVEKWKCGTCDTEFPCPTTAALDRNHV